MIRAIHIFGIILMLMGCSTAKISIEVYQPAKAPVDSTITTIGLINRADFNQVVLPSRVAHPEHLRGKYLEITENVLLALRIDFNEGERFSVWEIKRGAMPSSGKINGSPAPPESLTRVCQVYRLQGVVALEGVDYYSNADYSITESPVVDRNQGPMSIPTFNGSQRFEAEFFWRMYDCEGHVLGEPITTRGVYAIQAQSEHPEGVTSSLISVEKGLIEAGYEASKNYAAQISPYWKEVERTFYLYGNSDLYYAGNLALGGDWDEATDIWYSLTESPSKALARKASYNMILASEVAGEFDLAKAWAEKCITQFEMKQAKAYLKLLNLREKEIKELQRQLD